MGSVYWNTNESLWPSLKPRVGSLVSSGQRPISLYFITFDNICTHTYTPDYILTSKERSRTKPRPFLLLLTHNSLPLHFCLSSWYLYIYSPFHIRPTFPNHFLQIPIWHFSLFLCKFMAPRSHLAHLPPPLLLLSLTRCPHISFWLCLSLGPLSPLSTRLAIFFIPPHSLSSFLSHFISRSVFTVYPPSTSLPVPLFFLTSPHRLSFLSFFTLPFSCCIKSVSSV